MFVLAPFLLLATAPADAYSPADLADAQCVAVFAIGAAKAGQDASTDPKAFGGIVSGMTYFMGKLRGRSPAIDVEAILRAALPTLQKDPKPVTDRCLTETKALAEMMQAMGKSLMASGT